MSASQISITGDLKDVVVGNDGKVAYLSDKEGWVSAIDIATGERVGRWKVGASLGGMDQSQDGRYLVATEQTSAAAGTGYTLTVHVLDLTTGQVRDYQRVSTSPEPFYDAVFTADGKILLSDGGYWKPLWTLDPATGTFESSLKTYAEDGIFSTSRDGTKVIFAPQNISDLPLFLYESGKGITVGRELYQDDVSGYNRGYQAISPSGDLIVQHGYLFDGRLKYLGTLQSFQKEFFYGVGMAFSADGRSLFVLDQNTANIFQLSTADWSIQKVFASGLALNQYASSLFDYGGYGDRLTASSDGRYLVVLGDKQLNLIDLATITTAHGTDSSESLFGGASADTIRGFGGDDVIDGGGGADKLYGGYGNDRLIGGAGDDTLDGGMGVDTADYSATAGDIWADLSRGFAVQSLGGGRDGLISIENLIGSTSSDILVGDAQANVIEGRAGDDIIRGGGGGDTLRGGAGDDILWGDVGDDLLDGGEGVDIVSYEAAVLGVTIDLTIGGLQNTRGGGLDTLIGFEGITGSKFADTLTGDGQANIIFGGAGDDQIFGGGGDDLLSGGEGDDRIDGGQGFDTVRVIGRASDFDVVRNADGTIVISDLRSGAPQGHDTLTSIEAITFDTPQTALQITNEVIWLLRLFPQYLTQTSLSEQLYQSWAAGRMTSDQVMGKLMALAGATTSVASLAYQFFTGKIPGEAGIDYLVSPTGYNPNNLNSAYYAQFNPVNRYINFAVNLGTNGQTKDSFAAKYGALSLFDATREAYKTIFGAAPTDAKIHALIDSRVDYLASYGGDGANGIGTKAAMVGWLLAAAATEGVGVMAKSNEAWLTDLADGSAPFAVDILDPAKGYYKADFIFGG